MFALKSRHLFTRLAVDEINQQLDRAMHRYSRLELHRKEYSGQIWSSASNLYGGRYRVRWVFDYTLTQGEEETLISGRYRAPYDNFLLLFAFGMWPVYQIVCQLLGIQALNVGSRSNPFVLTEPRVVPALLVFSVFAVLFLGIETYQAYAKRHHHEKEEEEIVDFLKRQLKAVESNSF